eukprot:118122-Pelagomonas_calceolata.AAC.1
MKDDKAHHLHDNMKNLSSLAFSGHWNECEGPLLQAYLCPDGNGRSVQVGGLCFAVKTNPLLNCLDHMYLSTSAKLPWGLTALLSQRKALHLKAWHTDAVVRAKPQRLCFAAAWHHYLASRPW